MNNNADNRLRLGLLVGRLALWTLVVNACIPTAATPTRVEVTVIVPPLPIVVVPPPPSAIPTPTTTPVLPPGVASALGSWVMNFNYRLTGYPGYSDIRYSASLPVTVGLDGTISGSGMIFTTLVQPPCSTQVNAGNGASVAISGQIEAATPVPGSAVSAAVADLRLTPQDPVATQTFQLICSDAVMSDTRTVSILWSALAAAGQLHILIPFRPGIVLSGIRDVTAPSNEAVYGTLAFQIRIGQ